MSERKFYDVIPDEDSFFGLKEITDLFNLTGKTHRVFDERIQVILGGNEAAYLAYKTGASVTLDEELNAS